MKIEKLKETGVLGDVRQRLGAIDENDDSYDSEIEKMNSDEVLRCWSAWHLGYSDWWITMKRIYDKLEKP